METKYFDYIKRFLEQFLPMLMLEKLSSEEKIEKFRDLFKKDIRVEAICDMAEIEVEAMKDEKIENNLK